MLKIVQKTKIWFGISGVLIAIWIGALAMYGLNLGIDFKGGAMMEVEFTEDVPNAFEASKKLETLDYGTFKVQSIGEKALSLKAKELTNEQRNQVLNLLQKNYGEVEEKSFNSIGPSIGAELKKNAIYAIILVVVFIVAYISFAFRGTKGYIPSYAYGVSAIIALAHDLIMVVGPFALFSHFWGWEIDAYFVTALLTILGFSIHDTIVVFDRVRERIHTERDASLTKIVNLSINQTITRSVNTSFTTLTVLAILYFLGGESLKHFLLALIIGMAAGTYSSIFIASPLLILWNKISHKRI